MIIIVKKPHSEPKIMDVKGIDDIEKLVTCEKDSCEFYEREPIVDYIDMYVNDTAIFNPQLMDNIWDFDCKNILGGTIVFAGYNDESMPCSLTKEQIDYCFDYIEKRKLACIKTKRPQEFIRNSWEAILKIINPREYVGDMHSDDAYKYIYKSLNDKYSNSFYDKKTKEIFNIWWSSFKVNSKTDNRDVIRNSIMISKSAYKLIYENPSPKLTYDDFKSSQIKKNSYGEYLNKYLGLHLEHLTPMGYSERMLLKLQEFEIDDSHILECFNYSGMAMLTKEESNLLDCGSKVDKKDIELLQKLQNDLGTDIIKEISIDLAIELSNKSGKDASLKSNGDGLIRIVYLYNRGVRFVSPSGKELSIEETVKELVKNTFTIDQYKE